MAPTWLSHLQTRREQPDFSARWKAFIESPAASGEPTIRPARVPSVKPLKGQKADIFAMFRQRRG